MGEHIEGDATASAWRTRRVAVLAALGLALALVAAAVVLLSTGDSGGPSESASGPVRSSTSTTLRPTTTSTVASTTTTTAPPATTTTAPPPPSTVVVVVTQPPPPPPPPPPPAHPVTGTLYLFDAQRSVDGSWTVGQSCYGEGGYRDIGPGTPATVRNQVGTTIGATSLGEGRVEAWPEVSPEAKRCVFQFAFGPVADAEFYAFEVSDRGEVQNSRAELAAKGWHIDLHLG